MPSTNAQPLPIRQLELARERGTVEGDANMAAREKSKRLQKIDGKLAELSRLPQVMPLWISFALYRFEANVRSASVVGMVGAGGIGMVLWEVIRGFQYAQTAAVLLMLVAAVAAIDLLSARLRKRLV